MSSSNFASPNILLNPNSNQTIRIGSDDYIFEVFLTNTNGDLIKINHAAIKELVIEDIATNFYHFGSITYQNTYDSIESYNGITDTSNTNATGYVQDSNLQYTFRGDARDLLIINILPKVPGVPYTSTNIDAYKQMFNLKFTFCIYDTIDIPGEILGEKFKKLHFWDWSFEILNEKNTNFSTAAYINSPNTKNLSNNDRSLFTGDAIMKLLQTNFPTTEGYNTQFSNIWDLGGSKTFYTSPSDYYSIDDLHYLLKRHVSTSDNNYDFCLLEKDRYTDIWSFVSMKKLFDQAYNSQTNLANSPTSSNSSGGLTIEQFYISNQNDATTLNDNPLRSNPYEQNSIYLLDYSNLDDYFFKNTSGFDVQKKLVTTVVHSVSIPKKTFYMDLTNNNIAKARDIYFQNYVKNMKGDKGNSPSSNLTINQYRENQTNAKHIFTSSEDSHEGKITYGRNEILKSAIFLNNAVTFRVRGSTHRRSRRFLSIDMRYNVPNSKFFDKFLGIYFITEVKHHFIDNTYYNDLVCVKTYNYKDLKFDTTTI